MFHSGAGGHVGLHRSTYIYIYIYIIYIDLCIYICTQSKCCINVGVRRSDLIGRSDLPDGKCIECFNAMKVP